MKYYQEVRMLSSTVDSYVNIEGAGEVHSIFTKTMNIIDHQNQLLTLADDSFKKAPSLFRIKNFHPQLLDIKEGSKVQFKNNQLIIGNAIIIDYEHFFIDVERKLTYRNEQTDIFLKINQIRNASWYQEIMLAYQQQTFMRSVALKLQKNIKELKSGDKNSHATLLSALQQFIGLGVGLTPSGDDFLCGLALVASLENYPHKLLRQALQSVEPLMLEKTNAISSQQFKMALVGSARDEVMESLDALLSTQPYEKVKQPVQSILSIGSTSGFDILQGLLVGLELSIL